MIFQFYVLESKPLKGSVKNLSLLMVYDSKEETEPRREPGDAAVILGRGPQPAGSDAWLSAVEWI